MIENKIEYYLNEDGIEDVNGGMPCVQWDDTDTGGTYRAYVETAGPFNLRKKIYPIFGVMESMGKDGLWTWKADFSRTADMIHYFTAATGESEPVPYEQDLANPFTTSSGAVVYPQKLKSGLVPEGDFFKDNIGKPVLFPIFMKSVKKLYGLL